MLRITRIVALTATALFGTAALAQAPKPTWLDESLLPAAKAEGQVVVYSTTNEQEGLPLWKLFEDATGIKVLYVRASDAQILSRVIIEARANQRTWDISQTANVQKFPQDFLLDWDPPAAKTLMSSARGPKNKWFGVYANYNAPAYNTNLVKREDLPAKLEDFVKHPDWAGRIAIDDTDTPWLAAVFEHYGEKRAREILEEFVAKMKPVVLDGHLAIARAVGGGEYLFALNNYLNLTLNVKLAKSPTDFWVMEPVTLFFGQSGIAAKAPHPNAAKLAQNFMVSQEAQQFLTKFGRLPTRPDVETNPKGVLEPVLKAKVLTVLLDPEEEKKWSRTFKEIFRPR
jgi:iron(III) transport system substrate-binding protein